MKQLFIIVLTAFIFVSCSKDDDGCECRRYTEVNLDYNECALQEILDNNPHLDFFNDTSRRQLEAISEEQCG